MMIMNFNAEAAKAAVKNCEAMRQAALIEAAEKKVSSVEQSIMQEANILSPRSCAAPFVTSWRATDLLLSIAATTR